MSEQLPDHVVGIGGRWVIWRWIGLRGAGLPVAVLEDLALDPSVPDSPGAFADGLERTGEQLRALTRLPAFREALTWQNRRALHTGVDVLLAAAGKRSSKYRQKEALVAGYLQRYCAKNDTIGFFGPVGWARAVDTGPALTAAPGHGLLAERTTYLEGWCADRVAEVLTADEALLPWLPPRLLPFLQLAGDVLRAPLAGPVTLSPAEAATLRLCDGERPARDIVAAVAGAPGLDVADSSAAYALLCRLRAAGRIAWALEVPADDPWPEHALAERIARVGDDAARQRAERVLAGLRQHRKAVAAAAGDATALDAALAAFEAWFADLTGSAPVRRPGQLYAGRTLVHEDCRRDLDVAVGPELLAALGPPLELLLTAARWFTERAIELYRSALMELYERLTARTGRQVPLASLWLYSQDLLFGDGDDDRLRALGSEVRQRWATAGVVLDDRRRVRRSAADLRPAVLDTFSVTTTTPGGTRYSCPDVLIAATSPEAVRSGNYQLVLGELHAGLNTLTSGFFARHHPMPEQLLEAVERDLPEPQVVPVLSRDADGVTTRMMRGLVRPRDHRLVFARDTCGVPPAQALPIGSLHVERVGDRLEVRSRDGRVRFEAMAYFGELVMVRAHQSFGVLPPAEHTPRLTLDRLVVERERWRADPSELAFAWDADEYRRFCAARSWQEDRGLPRHVFVHPAGRAKPIYVDFAAPVLVDVLARSVRRAAHRGEAVALSEMLPGPDQVWLPDWQGRRYTSELRLVAIERP